jgi:hypothetical protein
MNPTHSPRRDRCASCDIEIEGRPVLRMDEAYCCGGCAEGGPCLCTYEADLADDGVNGLGLPFALPAPVRRVEPIPARTDIGVVAPSRR